MRTPDQISSTKFWLAARDIVPTSSQAGYVTACTDYFGEALTGVGAGPVAVNSHGFKALRFNGSTGLYSTGLAISPTTAVMLCVNRWLSSFGSSVGVFGLNGSADSSGIAIANGPTYQYYYNGAAGLQGAALDQNTRIPKDIHLAGFINGGTIGSGNTQIQVDGLRGGSFANTYATSSAGVLIGCLPAHGSAYQWSGDFYEALILSNPSSSDVMYATDYLLGAYDLPTPEPAMEYPLLIVDGNSVTEGFLCSSSRSTWWAVAGSCLNVPVEIRVTAKGGLTTLQNALLLGRDVYPLYNERRRLTMYLCWEATNDMADGSTPAQAYLNTVALFQAARVNMPRAKLVMPTIQPSAEISDANRTTYNNYVYNGGTIGGTLYGNWSSYADILWDIAADPTVGQVGQNVAPNYDSGGTHLADPGAIVFGKSLAKTLNSALFPQAALAYSNGGSAGY